MLSLFTVSFLQIILVLLKEKAKIAGQTQSGYIRSLILGYKPKELPKAASKKAPAPVVVEEKPTQTKSAESKQNKESNKEEN